MAGTPRNMGYRKSDLNKDKALLVVVVTNMSKEDRKHVHLEWSAHRRLSVLVGAHRVFSQRLPAEVDPEGSKVEVVPEGNRCEIQVRLRKVVPENWGSRWTPGSSPETSSGPPSPVPGLDSPPT